MESTVETEVRPIFKGKRKGNPWNTAKATDKDPLYAPKVEPMNITKLLQAARIELADDQASKDMLNPLTVYYYVKYIIT